MIILRLGDPHAKVSNLSEMKALILFVVEQVKVNKVDRIEILGDLFHNHNVIRLEVVEFWTWALDLLAKTCETVVLVGNHDISGDNSSNFSALSVFCLMNKQNLHIIEKPTQLGVFAYVPYTHNYDNFVDSVRTLSSRGAKVLVCHQTLQGSKYDNGMYAPDGFTTEGWAELFRHIISGHIHAEQSFGNILYPGTARWDTLSDANKRKGIWIYRHDNEQGTIQSANFISTSQTCSPIVCVEWRESDSISPLDEWPKNARMAVELIGSSAWVSQQKEKLKGKCSIKTKITDNKKSVVRKTGDSFEHFMKQFFVSTMDIDNLLKYAKEIGIV